MLSVVIPTLNAQGSLEHSLAALVPAAVDGIVREVIVVDAGSMDRTRDIAENAGATLVMCEAGRGRQLALGASRARFAWMLFLHTDTVLEPGWEREAATFIERAGTGSRSMAAAFRFALNDVGLRPRVVEHLVGLRCTLLRLPYGDQGLLIPKSLYQDIGGYRPLPLMEDVDLVRRLGRRRIGFLRARAVTSAERYRRDGYVRRAARNLVCLVLYFLRVPLTVVLRVYESTPRRQSPGNG